MKLNVKSLSYSTVLTIILIVVITILGELSKPFKLFLTSIGHYWVTKSLFSLIFFVLSYFLLSKFLKNGSDVKNEIDRVIIITILGTLVIFGFYLWLFIR